MKNESSRRFLSAVLITACSVIGFLCSNILLGIVWLVLALFELIWGITALKKENNEKKEAQKKEPSAMKNKDSFL